MTKKQRIPAMLLLILGAVIAAGSRSFLSPCVHEDGAVGACHWAGQALTGLGAVLGVLAVLALISARARFGLYLGAMLVCILGILTPGTLIRLCSMSTMRCRMIMQPAMLLLFSAALLCAAAGAYLEGRKAAAES